MAIARQFLAKAVDLARENVRNGGRPFGALVVLNGSIVAEGVNEVVKTHDPTAHAELLAIRAASRTLGTAKLDDCVVYASGHPCPMCLSAMYLSGIKEAAYAFTNEEAERFGLSSAILYRELAKPLAEQSLAISHTPVPADGQHPYLMWRAANPGSP